MGKTDELKKLVKDGFYFSKQHGNNAGITKLALQSLKTGFKAFFSTFHSCHEYILDANNDYMINLAHTPGYATNFYQSVIFIHHFFELILKDILRKESPLLALRFDDKKTDVLLKLVNKEDLGENDLSKLKSIEFTAALERICSLLKEEHLKDFGFIKDGRDALTELNTLRNRILHRGEYVLRYISFQKLICKYILPIIVKLLSLPLKSGAERKYKELACGTDPISEILSEVQKNDYSAKKVSLLMEMARAAYNNPLIINPQNDFGEYINKNYIERALKSGLEFDVNSLYAPIKCPVCSAKTLALKSYKSKDGLICALCSFQIRDTFKEIIESGDVPGIDKDIFKI